MNKTAIISLICTNLNTDFSPNIWASYFYLLILLYKFQTNPTVFLVYLRRYMFRHGLQSSGDRGKQCNKRIHTRAWVVAAHVYQEYCRTWQKKMILVYRFRGLRENDVCSGGYADPIRGEESAHALYFKVIAKCFSITNYKEKNSSSEKSSNCMENEAPLPYLQYHASCPFSDSN
jgi:hypothetical protein